MPVKKKTELEQLISDIHSYHLNYHSREIYLHSSFGGCCDDDELGVEYRMATAFIKNLHLIVGQNAELPILVHMQTVGGNWGDGMAIFNSIRFAPTPVTIVAYAQASSMSGIILQSADCRVLAPDCEFMIHHGSLAVADNSMAVKSAVDSNEKACRRMLDIFAKRARTGKYFKERGMSESKIKTFLDRKIKEKSDWYLSAEEAVHYGFADGILGESGYESLEDLKVVEKYKGKL
jgi:ATP-dependent protease ClpP protease subunit